MTTWNEEEDGMGFSGLLPTPEEHRSAMVFSSETNEYADFKVAEGERLAQELDAAQTNAYAEGRKDERDEVRAEVLRELLNWEAEYMQQARGGDNSGKSDARADAARAIHDHFRSSWDVRAKHQSLLRPAVKIAAPDKDAILRGAAIMRSLKEPPTRFDPWQADKDAQMNPATDGDPGLF